MTRSPARVRWLRRLPPIFWCLTVFSIVIWALVPGYVVGWDLNVYRNAFDSLRAGHDPYLDGIAVQRIFHAHLAEHPTAPPPYTYVYSPITLPLLHGLRRFPVWLIASVYWTMYALAFAAVVWVSTRFAEPEERSFVALAAPAAVFFPGLLQQDVLFSGNVAYLIYGAAFAAAYVGWRRDRWLAFYLVVLAASCFKAPLLTLLAVPLFSARRQWLPAFLVMLAGVALFAMQPRIWPALFQHYLQAVELQFSFNHDFSSSPAGLLAGALYNVVPYQITSVAAYLLYGSCVGAVLLFLSRRYRAGLLSWRQWGPVMLIGVILLNPRIMEYDVAPLTISMALVLWRVVARHRRLEGRALRAGILFAVANGIAAFEWRWMECLLLLGIFAAGSYRLIVEARQAAMAVPGRAEYTHGHHDVSQRIRA